MLTAQKILIKLISWLVTALIPLLFAGGAGAASRYSIGIVVVSSLLIGTLLTLFVLPTIYSLIARDHRNSARSERARELAEEFPERL